MFCSSWTFAAAVEFDLKLMSGTCTAGVLAEEHGHCLNPKEVAASGTNIVCTLCAGGCRALDKYQMAACHHLSAPLLRYKATAAHDVHAGVGESALFAVPQLIV